MPPILYAEVRKGEPDNNYAAADKTLPNAESQESSMNFQDAVRSSFNMADFMVQGYLADITPQELMMRPAPDANHIAWQLGHLIASERHLIEAAVPGSIAKLPDGFVERHTKDFASSDDSADFLSKDEYRRLAAEVRAGTLNALDQLSETDFDKPVAGRVPPFVKRVGDCFVTVGSHWIMHAGQWVVLRRKLGRPRMF
jgi:hypothetical protein